MPTYFAAPIWTRKGVVAGFVLGSPVFRGIQQPRSELQYISITLPASSFWNFQGSVAGAFNTGLQINPLLSVFLITRLVQWIGNAFTGNAYSVPMSNAANQAQALLAANLASWQALAPVSRTSANQGLFVANFYSTWNAYVNACNAIIANDQSGSDAQKALQRSIDDRERGGKFDWFAAYLDPIANDATTGDSGSGGALGSIQFQFYNTDVTLLDPTLALTIGTGFQHWLNIGGRQYNYYQLDGDTPATIAAALAAAVNAGNDPYAVASDTSGSGTYADGRVVLSPRVNTGAEISCTASETNRTLLLVELTGQELIPQITKGVLFAQGQMYRPAAAPQLPAAPPNQLSYLYYSSVNGFYWSASSMPQAGDDACIGWVVATADEIIAVGSRRIGTGTEAQAVTAGPVSTILVNVSASGDTGAPTEAPALGFSVAPSGLGGEQTPGQLMIAAGFGGDNTAGIDVLVAILYYIDELAGPVAKLTDALAAEDTSLHADAALPVSAPQAVIFTFSAETVTVSGVQITIGPGYVHSITIGTTTYSCVQETGDTAETIAAALAATIQAAVDPNAMAAANGAQVILTPLGSNGQTYQCSASDGNTPQTLTETQPSYYLVESPEDGSEIVQVAATDGSAIQRGCLGGKPAALPAGSLIWQVQSMPRFYSIPGALIGTANFPYPTADEPFRAKGLVAFQAWAANEFGDSPAAVAEFSSQYGGRLRALSGGQLDLSFPGVLAIQADVCPAVMLGQAVSVRSITASVKSAPVGAGVQVRLSINATAFMTLTIADGKTVSVASLPAGAYTTDPATVDGIVLAAEQPITLDVLQVGTDYPGSDLAVSVKF